MPIPTKYEILNFSKINQGKKEIVPKYKRKWYLDIKKGIKSNFIISICGFRRVGKTTLIKQILNELCDDQEVFYFSFDEQIYSNYEALKNIIEVFLAESDRPLIALDEISNIEGWAGLLKRYYDHKGVKFIVSGSSSLKTKKGKESLAGRIIEFSLPPLQFDEYLELSNKYKEPKSLFRSKRYKEELEKFLDYGSFPELCTEFDEKLIDQYIRNSTLEKIIFEDIPSVFRIEHVNKLFDLLVYVATISGSLFNILKTSEILQISKNTVSDYMFYLENAYVSYQIYTEGSLAKSFRKMKKVFVSSPSIYTHLTKDFSYGARAEVAVFDKLMNSFSNTPKFFRDSQKHEVDFIFKKIPIEVKFQENIAKSDLKNLIYYMKKKNKDSAIVITKNMFDEREIASKKILFIPLDVFISLKEFPL